MRQGYPSLSAAAEPSRASVTIMKRIMANIGREFVRHIVPQIIKPLRSLWNEVIGFVFLSLAAIPIPRTFRMWREFHESGEGLFRICVALIFIVLMGAFGIHSFLRARRISRS